MDEKETSKIFGPYFLDEDTSVEVPEEIIENYKKVYSEFRAIQKQLRQILENKYK